MGAEAGIAPGSELGERHGILHPPPSGEDAPAAGANLAHLGIEQRGEVAGMESVADLFAGTVETDVAKRATTEVGVDPIGENSLVGRAELAGAGENAAAVDPDGEAE